MTKQQLFSIRSEYADLQGEYFELEYDYYYCVEMEKINKYLAVNKSFVIDEESQFYE